MTFRRTMILWTVLVEIAFLACGILCATGTIPIHRARIGILILCLTVDIGILYLSGWWIALAEEIDKEPS